MRSALDVPFHNQVWLVYFLERAGFFADRHSKRIQTDWSAIEFVDQRFDDALVPLIEAIAIDLEHGQRAISQLCCDFSICLDLHVIAHPSEEIVRRAFETVRLMNTEVLNGNHVVKGQANLSSNMPVMDNVDANRASDPIMARGLVDNLTLLNLHQNVLTALRSGTAPWITDVLRNYDEVGDLTDVGRRKMPALMRGADGRHLALTRRQIDLIRKVGQGPIFSERPRTKKGNRVSSKRGRP